MWISDEDAQNRFRDLLNEIPIENMVDTIREALKRS